ncbi:glycosyltransferase family 2 protein [Paenibacillus sambharensis]|uniref:Glycosyltransferase family 2 protein n=1 Tax=Paenibacillus sambharensis TaxID=1803190 RepID=A0A2W1LCY1_9BACL|nr:glycosyltransferase [Paenibacillus sambharensis]PZD96529.1 glycosyltransferase family 2 protein [Paenibacillus sambharensis]
MAQYHDGSIKSQGVSIITCTNRRGYMRNLINNYKRQRHPKKELIIIINCNSIPLAPYRKLTAGIQNIRIYQLPERYTLGACLNYAVDKANYSCIAKFDDDDYYAPYYLTESLETLKRAKADVLGKKAHYMYLRGSKKLLLRFQQYENRQTKLLPGATLVFKRSVFNKVRFPNRNVGEDDLFCLRSRRAGYKVYSGSRYNFAAIRRKNSANHTWIISDRELISHHKIIPGVRSFRKFVQKPPQGKM